MSANNPSIREAFLEASSFLEHQGVAEANHCAELLLCHLLDCSRSELFLRWQDPFPSALKGRWGELLRRKAQGEPVQYLIGETEFYGLPFAVGPAVLIPRPETELLVERILQIGRLFWARDGNNPPVLADIGTGSGAIAVTIAVHCPHWLVYSSDLSDPALEMARHNAVKNRVEGRIRFLSGDLVEPYAARGLNPDILVSNPPYIPTGDLPGLQREVKDFEPRSALDGGDDGLFFYRRLVKETRRLEKRPRLIGFEVGLGQAEVVAGLLREEGAWPGIEIVRDLAGIQRHVIGLADDLLDC
jgi:release factor glutamine methyltransferase